MTKADIVEQLIHRTGMARSAAMEAVDNIVAIIADNLSKGESIFLRGLGTFDVRTTKEKIGRNINKGEAVTIPAHKTVKLVLSKKIKDALK
ncbi:HU family DNA-binding protein [bacterium]|nr:HU family DNA-binding protein [bacterium]